MSREILFRGKIKNWKEQSKENQWVEGYYCKRKSGHYTDIGFEEEYKDCIIKEFSDGGTTFCDVDPSTVCQYTGLTDRNGKKIWGNDRCCVQRPGVLAYGTIKYLEGCFCFVEDKTGNILRLCIIRENRYSIKVEGNIFDKT